MPPPDRPAGSAEETGGADERREESETVQFFEPWRERVSGSRPICRYFKAWVILADAWLDYMIHGCYEEIIERTS
jgi:hypothetical protein